MKNIWNQVLNIIEENTTSISYNTWFKPIKIKNIDKNVKIVYLETDEDFIIKVLKDRYLQLIESSFKTVTGEEYRVVIKNSSDYETIKEESPQQQPVLMDPKLRKQKIFNPRYTFDNFVVGGSNKYAHAAALAVAESPSEAYNPLFIYGGSGLGKTHLMNAIGIYLLENNENLNVLYVSSEMFTNEFIKALGENKTREFKNKYRKVDVLLIDDIQFLEGKDTMQEEFFHTFNSLYDLNKQIVISSDRAPNKLDKLEERLRSRFMWNLIADLQPADYETRVAILMKKAPTLKWTMTFTKLSALLLRKSRTISESWRALSTESSAFQLSWKKKSIKPLRKEFSRTSFKTTEPVLLLKKSRLSSADILKSRFPIWKAQREPAILHFQDKLPCISAEN